MRFIAAFCLALLPLLLTAQLKEFDVIQLPQPDVAVVQANTTYPDDAILIIYTPLQNLDFRSSIDVLDKQSYNAMANRYEILVKPRKQMIFVRAANFMECKIATINPSAKEAYYYKVEEKINEKLLGMAAVKINSEPQGCDILINGLQLVNKTPFAQEMAAGPSRIVLKKTRYLDTDTVVRIVPGTENNFAFKLKPAWADLTIKTNFAEALITINGQNKGYGGVNYQGLEFGINPGQYFINVSLDKYRPYTKTLDLKAGQIEHLNVMLEAMTGTLGVASEPADADVLVNGRKMGVTPYRTQLPIGDYTLEVEKQGYKKEKYSFALKDNDTKEFKPKLINYSDAINPLKRKSKRFALLALSGAAGAAAFYYSGIYAYQEYPKATTQAANLRRYVIASDILAPTMAALCITALVPTVKFTFKTLKLKREFGLL